MICRRGGRYGIKVDRIILNSVIQRDLAIRDWTLLDGAVFTEKPLFDAAFTRRIFDWLKGSTLKSCEYECIRQFEKRSNHLEFSNATIHARNGSTLALFEG